MSAWLGVVSANHVQRGVSLGIAQINHGKRTPLARMQENDWLIYYSPKVRMDGDETLRSFTAIGRLPDNEIWQADEGDFKPFRRRVQYRVDAEQAPVEPLKATLDLTSGPNWGYQLRRGLVPLSDRDFEIIRAAMGITS